MLAQVLIGLILAAGIAAASLRFHALTLSGALAATIVGGIVFGAGGVAWSVLLLVFFATSSALSRFPKRRSESIVAKGGRRDAGQVLANGGVPVALAIGALAVPAFPWIIPYAGALAAANADTWATEIGRLSPSRPRLISTLHVVPPGTSGGVTGLGLIASAAGAATIAFVASIVAAGHIDPFMIGIAGVCGSLVDSLLGATVQEVRRCPACGAITEQTVHTPCGAPTRAIRGIAHLNNDAVNALASAFAALLAGAAATV